MNDCAFEIDHVFVTVRKGVPELNALLRAGFSEGPPNVHPGQGTACRRVFFDNAYLELLWLEDAAEAVAPPVGRTGLADRTRCTDGASRLGVALRSRAGTATEPPIPIRTWPYQPPYLPSGRSLPVAANADVLREPLLFFVPEGRRSVLPCAAHPNGTRRITEIGIVLPAEARPSPELAWLSTVPGVQIESGEAELLTVELDRGIQGRSASLAPSAPLRAKW